MAGFHSVFTPPAEPTAVKFMPTPFPGAGIIGAGSFVKEFNTISNTDPVHHMKRLTAALVGWPTAK